MNNIHAWRIATPSYHVPVSVLLMLIGIAVVAMGFAGYDAGEAGARRFLPHLIVSITVASLIVSVIDLDGPNHGLNRVQFENRSPVFGQNRWSAAALLGRRPTEIRFSNWTRFSTSAQRI